MKQFTIPLSYRSPFITAIKEKRKELDKMKKDFTPTVLDFGPIQIILARHFGFCYGVENAIEIAFKTIDENQGKRIFLLSEMIHNPSVNQDLKNKGVQFLQDTKGNTLFPFDQLTKDDIVIIPAFGTTIEIEQKLQSIGISIEQYNTTCPFVEKVWNRSEQISKKQYTVVVHGKPSHEETRATFSHAAQHTPTIVVNDMQETVMLSKYITGEWPIDDFFQIFKNRCSPGFDPLKDLERIGVVNQTTMLASDTQEIADFLKDTMIKKYQLSNEDTHKHFADTRDTLCYATNDNQTAVQGLLAETADLAIVVGGYNSSNTSHLVELCEAKLPTYFIDHCNKIQPNKSITHFNFHNKEELTTAEFIPEKKPVKILMTSGASCPDALVEKVIDTIVGFYLTGEVYNHKKSEILSML